MVFPYFGEGKGKSTREREREILQEKLKSPKTGVGVGVADVNHMLLCSSSALSILFVEPGFPAGN